MFRKEKKTNPGLIKSDEFRGLVCKHIELTKGTGGAVVVTKRRSEGNRNTNQREGSEGIKPRIKM